MDKSQLLAREPILFFADIPLYESELDDNGASQLSVKVHLNPSCVVHPKHAHARVPDSYCLRSDALFA